MIEGQNVGNCSQCAAVQVQLGKLKFVRIPRSYLKYCILEKGIFRSSAIQPLPRSEEWILPAIKICDTSVTILKIRYTCFTIFTLSIEMPFGGVHEPHTAVWVLRCM